MNTANYGMQIIHPRQPAVMLPPDPGYMGKQRPAKWRHREQRAPILRVTDKVPAAYRVTHAVLTAGERRYLRQGTSVRRARKAKAK